MVLYYVGNMSCETPTTIDTLTPLLRPFTNIRPVSPLKNKLLRLLDMAGTVGRAKRKDLVMIDVYSTQAFHFAWICGIICRIKKIRYIAYLHGGDLASRVDRNHRWQNAFFSRSSLILAPSMFMLHAMKERGFNKVRFIPNSIHLGNYTFKKRTQVRPRLLWVRSFHRVYNPEMAIFVITALAKQYEDAQLCMVGPEKDETLQTCKKLAESLGVQNRVIFTGRLTKTEWIQMAADYDIFINTTNYDNTPVSVIEAMALGLPIVSTNAGGLPFLLTDRANCLMVKQNDSNAMVNAIQELVSDATLTESITTNARHTAEKFDWQLIKKQWVDIIKNNDHE